MVAETVSLGVLSLPAAVASLGLAPYVSSPKMGLEIRPTNSPHSSIVALLLLGMLATYTGYAIGQFKWRYPQVCNMADAGEVIAGRIGREVLGVGQVLFLVFVMASHLLTFIIAMNAITGHGTCSIVFGLVGLIISFICSLPRTLVKMSWLSFVCMRPVPTRWTFWSLVRQLIWK